MGKALFAASRCRIMPHLSDASIAAWRSPFFACSKLFSAGGQRIGFVRTANAFGALRYRGATTSAALGLVRWIGQNRVAYLRGGFVCCLSESRSPDHSSAIRATPWKSECSRTTLHFFAV